MSASPSRITVDSRKVDELEAAICGLARKLNSATYRMLELIRDFDDRFGWAKWGHKSCAEWLHWRCQISLSAAREQVRTAQALRRLPKLSAALAEGEISYTKVRALTRVATEHDEDLLLAYARKASAQDVEDRVRQMRNTAPESAAEARRVWERRSLTVSRRPGRGTFLISIEVPEADGEIIVRAIERAVASGDVPCGLDHFTAHGEDRSKTDGWCAQQADAIVAVAKAYLARTGRRAASDHGVTCEDEDDPALEHENDARSGSANDAAREGDDDAASEGERKVAREDEGDAARDANAALSALSAPLSTSVADHYQVVVHVDEKSLRGGTGRADLPLPTIERLTCDCNLIMLIEDEHGNPLALGRKTRNLSTSLRRFLRARDRHCTFPGCTRCIVDFHHIKHWRHGGASDAHNLTALCTYHHTLLHEGGFSIRKLADGSLEFLRPDGRVIPQSGYLREDIVDDYDGDDHEYSWAEADTSAEGSQGSDERGPDAVREMSPVYEARRATGV